MSGAEIITRKKDFILEKVKKKGALRLPARAGIWSIISGLVSRGVGVVGTPIFTRLLTPAEYGVYPLYTTWLSLISSVVISSFAGSAIYRGLQRHSERKEEFISAATGLGLTICLGISAVCLIARDTVTTITGLTSGSIMLLLFEIALSSVLAFRSALLRYEYKYKSLAITNLLTSVLTPIIAIMFVFLTPYRSEARMLGSVISLLIVALPILLRAVREGRLYDAGVWKYLLRVNLPLIPHYLATGLILRISEIVIGRSHGEAALAKYSVGISVGLALTFLTNALSQVITPWIIRKERDGSTGEIKEAITLALGMLASATLLILAIAPEILDIMTPSEYADALPTVYPLALSVNAMFLSNVISAAEAYYERSMRASLPTVITAIATASASVILLPRLDYRISSLFTLGAYIILATLSALMFRTISGKSIINARKCTLLLSFTAFYASMLFISKDSFTTRLILAILILPITAYLLYKTYVMVKEKS